MVLVSTRRGQKRQMCPRGVSDTTRGQKGKSVHEGCQTPQSVVVYNGILFVQVRDT